MPRTAEDIEWWIFKDSSLRTIEEQKSRETSIWYSQDELDSLLHQKWMDTIHEMQRAHRRADEVKRKAVYDFIDAIESQTDNWDILCDCDCDGKDPSDDKFGHSKDCMTMNARHDVEQLLRKLDGE